MCRNHSYIFLYRIYMDILLLYLWTSFQVIGCTIIFYSAEKKTYTDALDYCKSIGGNLAPYGSKIIDAADKCNLIGYVWLGKPWLRQIGCYKIDATIEIPLRKWLKETSSFECSDICSNITFEYIAITNSSCSCFTNIDNSSVLQDSSFCQKVNCGNKTGERCGFDKYSYINQKVYKIGEREEHHSFQRLPSGSVALYKNPPGHPLYFFCLLKEGNSDEFDIKCSTPDNPISPSITVTPKQDFGTSYSLITSSILPNATIFVKIGDVPPRNDSGMPVIIGSISSVILVAIILSFAVMCCKQRVNKQKKVAIPTKDPDKNTHRSQEEANYELPPDIESEHDDGVYDHTNHTLVYHDDISGNIYDHSYTVEGLYDSTIVTRVTPDNTYGDGFIMSVKNSNKAENSKTIEGNINIENQGQHPIS